MISTLNPLIPECLDLQVLLLFGHLRGPPRKPINIERYKGSPEYRLHVNVDESYSPCGPDPNGSLNSAIKAS